MARLNPSFVNLTSSLINVEFHVFTHLCRILKRGKSTYTQLNITIIMAMKKTIKYQIFKFSIQLNFFYVIVIYVHLIRRTFFKMYSK